MGFPLFLGLASPPSDGQGAGEGRSCRRHMHSPQRPLPEKHWRPDAPTGRGPIRFPEGGPMQEAGPPVDPRT
eukprot:6393119-Pyramimonas_sp.AAC.2